MLDLKKQDHKRNIMGYATEELRKLRAPGTIVTAEYENFLTRLSQGKCMICDKDIAVVKLDELEDGFKYYFQCGHNWSGVVKNDLITVHDSIRARVKSPGYRKFAWELLQGWFPSHKFPSGVFQKRTIDRVHDHYDHLIIDEKTGEIDHYECKKLSEHKGKSHYIS